MSKPFCVDCVHYLKKWWYKEPLCDKSRIVFPPDIDMVTGKVKRKERAYARTCADERKISNTLGCGYGGKYFEKREG